MSDISIHHLYKDNGDTQTETFCGVNQFNLWLKGMLRSEQYKHDPNSQFKYKFFTNNAFCVQCAEKAIEMLLIANGEL